MKIGVYPGSFDPITNGHIDIIKRAVKLLDKLIVAVVKNPNKTPLFSFKERMNILKNTLKNVPKVEIASFSGLLVNFLKHNKANVIIKGLRALSDFEFEFQMALMNRQLDANIETIFLMTSSRYTFLSSSSVKEISSLGGSIKGLVPPYVESKLKEKFGYLKRPYKGQDVVCE